MESSSSGAGFRPGSGQCVCMDADEASEGDDCGRCWLEQAPRELMAGVWSLGSPASGTAPTSSRYQFL